MMSSAPPLAPSRPSSNGDVQAQLPATGRANGTIAYKDSDAHTLWAVVSLMLGILVAALGFFALMMWLDAHNAKNAADRAAAKVSKATPSATSDLGALKSYAGAAPSNADALAAAHRPFPAAP
jgi:hypothetical protein